MQEWRWMSFPESQNSQITLKVISIPAVGIPRCIIGANLVIAAQIHSMSSHVQVEFLSQNNLEGQGQWPTFSIPVASIPGCMYGANLVILAQIYDELSCRKVIIIIIIDHHEDLGVVKMIIVVVIIIIITMPLMDTSSATAAAAAAAVAAASQVYGRKDRCRQRKYPFGLKGQGLKFHQNKVE